jgi:hypothetical protein
MEAQAQDLDLEVDGIAMEVALGPAPIRLFDDEAGEGGQLEVARLLFDELEAAFLQERDRWCLSNSMLEGSTAQCLLAG